MAQLTKLPNLNLFKKDDEDEEGDEGFTIYKKHSN